jgi:transposase
MLLGAPDFLYPAHRTYLTAIRTEIGALKSPLSRFSMNPPHSQTFPTVGYPPPKVVLEEASSSTHLIKEAKPPGYLEQAAPVAQQATIERIDDIPLLMALQQRIGLDAIIDAALPRHGLLQGLSIGQLVLGWNTFILSQADHRKVTVRDWVIEHRRVLEQLMGTEIRETDFTDDRLAIVLRGLSNDTAWRTIESELWQISVAAYSLEPQQVRLDATTVSGTHTVASEGVMQYGYGKDQQFHPQAKVMVGSIDTQASGHLVATEIASGERGEDPLYLPILARMRQTLKQPGLLYLGDSKMSAIATRADIVAHRDFYLMPLTKVGEIPQLLDKCIDNVVYGTQEVTLIFSDSDTDPEPRLVAAGYETARSINHTNATGQSITWTERLLVVRSFADASKEAKQLQKRLDGATEALFQLTPDPQRGRRQIREEDQLHQKAQAILSRFGVEHLLDYRFKQEETTKTQYIGRGRGGSDRPKRTIKTVRYVITDVHRNETAIAQATWRLGWRLYATNAPQTDLTLCQGISTYRHAPRIERHFHLLKDAPISIEPLYVRRDDQIKGLIRLLCLLVRLLTLMEIVVRRSLAQQGESLAGLYEGHPNRQTDRPTATRLLKAFRQIDRGQLSVKGQCITYLTPLTPLQRRILSLLQLSESVYEELSFYNSE